MTAKAAAVVRIEQRLLGPFDTFEFVWKRARVEFERRGIDLERVTRIETELTDPPPFFGRGCWEITVRIEYDE